MLLQDENTCQLFKKTTDSLESLKMKRNTKLNNRAAFVTNHIQAFAREV